MTGEGTRARPVVSAALLLFVVAVVAHLVAVVTLGKAAPGGLRADVNVYLELASNLWEHGEYGTRVSVTYPPLFPMLVAPFFAIESKDRKSVV